MTEKRAVKFNTVQHPYDKLAGDEIDPKTGCSVCMEDQEMITVAPLEPFYICRKIAPAVHNTLKNLIAAGEPVQKVIGYRVSKTRGDVDKNGDRTVFSNHSYGTAIDINSDLNGLYDNCLEFGPSCRLLMGGRRQKGVQGTLEPDGAIVKAFKTAGFLWGGKIKGRQKDFMHFSLTGY